MLRLVLDLKCCLYWSGIHGYPVLWILGRFEFLFGFVQIVLTITNLEKLGSFFCRFICCLCLMKQNSDDLHACTMDSVILMKGFEFICPLSKRFFGYFILLNISFLLKWKIRLDYIFEKLMKISCVDFIFDFMFVMSGFKMFVPDLWKR
jgi:hypothetical protein